MSESAIFVAVISVYDHKFAKDQPGKYGGDFGMCCCKAVSLQSAVQRIFEHFATEEPDAEIRAFSYLGSYAEWVADDMDTDFPIDEMIEAANLSDDLIFSDIYAFPPERGTVH